MSGFTPAQIAYMEANIDATKVPGFVAAIVICCSVATIAMVLRVIAKASTKNGYGMDDVFAFFGWIGNLGYTIASGISVKFGMGRHIIVVTDPRGLIIAVTVAECFFNFTIMFIKLSILTFYARIFPQRGFHILIWVVSVVAVLQNVPAIFLTIFQCVPISAQWDPLVKATATCINYHAVTIAFGVLNIITDLLILAMPVPLVWNLQVGRKKKMLICAAFGVGALACIIDIVRLAYSSALDSADTTWTYIPALITTSVELAVGLLCACVPLYRPLLAKIFKNLESPTKYSTSKSNSHTLKSIGTKRQDAKGWDTISDDTAYLQEERGEAGGIRIQRDYSVSSSHS